MYSYEPISMAEYRWQIQRTNGLWHSAEYSTFSISDEVGKYRLTVAGYSGDAGDALANAQASNWIANGRMFSTQDNDNDIHLTGSCSKKGGWWYVSSSSSSDRTSSGRTSSSRTTTTTTNTTTTSTTTATTTTTQSYYYYYYHHHHHHHHHQ